MNATNEISLTVDNMTCPSCSRHVTHALKSLDGIDEVSVRIREKRVVVRHDPTLATEAAMIEALNEAGYPARREAA